MKPLRRPNCQRGAESGTGERKAGQVRYWQYGLAKSSPDLAILDLSRFRPLVPLPSPLTLRRNLAFDCAVTNFLKKNPGSQAEA